MKPTLKICAGSDCKKHRRRNRKIRELLEPHCKVGKMKCQDFCKGPVIQITHGKRRTWFKKLRGKKTREDLRTFVLTGEMSKRLKGCVARQK